MSISILAGIIHIAATFLLAVHFVRRLANTTGQIQRLSHKREYDNAVIWNLLFSLRYIAKSSFMFPHDQENPEVVKAFQNNWWIGRAAFVAIILCLLSGIAYFLTIFVGPPGVP